MSAEETKTEVSNFIKNIIEEDLAAGKNDGRVATRFPPEPNGYLHVGHAKSICLNFGLAEAYNGSCNLRFDDSNPAKEETEYVEAIKKDISWLGFDWGSEEFFASSYFDRMYELAVELIKQGKAYVCSLSAEETRKYRGTLTEPGKNSPHRDRSVEENLDLFARMKDGEFEDGEHILRAKIDMASPNLNLRDPALYRIRKVEHHRTGDKWKIYPMYDYCHCLSDSFENITHSVCTLEFEDHRPLYDWLLDQFPIAHPQQIEFARLNFTYTILSKRKLLELVEGGHVDGWDDPRMPTLSGMRRRGYTADAIKNLCEKIGVAKANSVVDWAYLDFFQREDLNAKANRAMVVLNPLKLVIDNYPEGQSEMLESDNNPNIPEAGKREIPFSRELYVEQEDFAEIPPGKWRRLTPGKEVRLVNAYYVTCTDLVKNDAGEVIEVHCTYDPKTKGGWSEDGRKVKGSIHWVSAAEAKPINIRMYDYLFREETPGSGDVNYLEHLNPDSLKVLEGALAEPGLLNAKAGEHFQFLRNGYFCVDSKDSKPGEPVFNRTVGLRDSFAKKGK